MKVRVSLLLLVASLLFSGSAFAAGFALIEQSVKGLGTAFSGGAASADDASTVYFNPAGMTRIEGAQAIAGVHYIVPSAQFTGTGTSPAALGGPATGGNGGDGGVPKLVPNFYLVAKAGPNCSYGIGVNTPFGLATKYDPTWVGRFHGIESEIMTININPSVAYKLGALSLGAGFSAQYIDATLTQISVLPGPIGTYTKVTGDSWGYGFNLGALYELSADTRVGASYRSSVFQSLKGEMSIPAAATTLPITGKIRLPGSAQVSVFHRLTPQLDLMADVMWTDWSTFDKLTINTPLGANTTEENWEDNMRYSLGGAYHASEALTLRAGVAYDQTPIPDNYRTPRIPGNDRTWIALGAGYAVDALTFDVAYAHLFVTNGDINLVDLTGTRGNLAGTFENKVDIVSAEMSYKF